VRILEQKADLHIVHTFDPNFPELIRGHLIQTISARDKIIKGVGLGISKTPAVIAQPVSRPGKKRDQVIGKVRSLGFQGNCQVVLLPADFMQKRKDFPFTDDEITELASNLKGGVPMATPVFDGASEGEIKAMLKLADLPEDVSQIAQELSQIIQFTQDSLIELFHSAEKSFQPQLITDQLSHRQAVSLSVIEPSLVGIDLVIQGVLTRSNASIRKTYENGLQRRIT